MWEGNFIHTVQHVKQAAFGHIMLQISYLSDDTFIILQFFGKK